MYEQSYLWEVYNSEIFFKLIQVLSFSITRKNKSVFSTHTRHVILPKEIAKKVPKRLMSEQEWRSLGIQMPQGWENYLRHEPGKCLSCLVA